MPQDEMPPQQPGRRPEHPQFGQYDDAHRGGRIPDEEIARMREREERRRRLEAEERDRENESSQGRASGRQDPRQVWTGRPEDGTDRRAEEPLRYRSPQEREGFSEDRWTAHRGASATNPELGAYSHGTAHPSEDPRRVRRLAVWAAVLGTLGLVLSIFTVPVVLGIAGLVCGIVALVRSRRARTGRGLAMVGIVTGLLSVVVTAIMVFTAWSMLVDHCGSPFDRDQSAWQQCGYDMIGDMQQGR